MSFGESVFSAGFIQKTVKVDLHVGISHAYPLRNEHQKTLEDSRGHHTKAGGETPPGGANQPLGVPPISLLGMSVLHCLLGCIYVVL